METQLADSAKTRAARDLIFESLAFWEKNNSNKLNMVQMNKCIKRVAVALALAMPLTTGIISVSPVHATDPVLSASDTTEGEIGDLLAGKTAGKPFAAGEEAYDYTLISEVTREFWENLEPLSDPQDLEAFKAATLGMCEKTAVPIEIVSVTQPKEIPFEELNPYQAGEVSKGNKLYQGVSAEFRVRPAYIKYCNDVIIPKLCEFFEPLAKSVTRKDVNCVVGNGMRCTFDGQSEAYPAKEKHLTIRLYRIKDMDAAMKAAPGTSVAAELIAFHLPEVYTNFYGRITDCITVDRHTVGMCSNAFPHLSKGAEAGLNAYIHALDVDGKQIWTSSRFDITTSTLWCGGKTDWGFSIVQPISIPGDKVFDRCIANFDLFTEQREAELQEQAVFESIKRIFIVLCLFGGMAGYGIYVLRKEYKRRWKALPLPEGCKVYIVDEDVLRSEFEPFKEWKSSLVWQESADGEGGAWSITEKKVVDKGYEILYSLSKLPDLNEHEITALNNLGTNLNNAQARHLSSSKWLLAGYTISYMFLAAQLSVLPYAASTWLGVMTNIVFVIAIASIFIADLMPNYKIGNEEPLLIRGIRRVLKAVGVGAWLMAIFAATQRNDTFYKDSSGNVYVEKDDGLMGCCFSLLFLSILVFLLPFIALGNSIASFIRNYIGNK